MERGGAYNQFFCQNRAAALWHPQGSSQSHTGKPHKLDFFLRRNVSTQIFHLYDLLLLVTFPNWDLHTKRQI